MQNNFGVIIIGRNEGDRLRLCFESLVYSNCKKIYVDSGSIDNSLDFAKDYVSETLSLSPDIPFSAARARNEGFARLLEISPDIAYVQFIDGDCFLADGWLDMAADFLDAHSDVAVVCGRLHERFPERSIYNRLCDMEWDTTIGNTLACGGIAMVRVNAFTQAGGFRIDLIAGEEPELCVRLRRLNWKIWRLDASMAFHDAAITQFRQWWRRAERSGYAFAEGAYLHGASPERLWVKESRSIWFWACIIPIFIITLGALNTLVGLGLLLIYPLQVLRLSFRNGGSHLNHWLWAFFLVLGKFPEFIGQLRFWFKRLVGVKVRLIEYK